ncbi:MAG: T9SS type A sorting domain-containing protein [Chitinophagales bacterium]
MKIKHFLLLFILIEYIGLRAQYDKHWIVGGPWAKLTFEGDTITTDTFPNSIDYSTSLACISDSNGMFQFLATGTQIHDRNNDTMEGGTYFQDSAWTNLSSTGSNQNMIILPGKNKNYYLFHQCMTDSLEFTTPYYMNRLYFAVINMDSNNGLGKVISKKNLLYDGKMGKSNLTACVHGNGRDYWLFTCESESNQYIKFLVTPDTILGPYFQTIGTPYGNPDWVGTLRFSNDGKKLYGVSGNSRMNIFDFDRCTGMLSNPYSFTIPRDTIFNTDGSIHTWGGGAGSATLSPSGRFLYICKVQFIHQYDLWGDSTSRVNIWTWDSTYGFPKTLFSALMPNGQIIIGNYHGVGSHGFHLIKYPDSLGTACGFKWNGLYAPTINSTTINNSFNYRLGADHSGSCDSLLTSIPTIDNHLLLYPNPASSKVYFNEMNIQAIEVWDAFGNRSKQLIQNQKIKELDISDLPNGIYLCSFRLTDGKTVSSRFAKTD